MDAVLLIGENREIGESLSHYHFVTNATQISLVPNPNHSGKKFVVSLLSHVIAYTYIDSESVTPNDYHVIVLEFTC
jgi:hypothetical protein